MLFHLGLELSVDEFVHSGRALFLAGGVFIAMNITAGLSLGFGLNWGDGEALVNAGIVLAVVGPVLAANSGLLARVLPPALDRRSAAVPRLS